MESAVYLCIYLIRYYALPILFFFLWEFFSVPVILFIYLFGLLSFSSFSFPWCSLNTFVPIAFLAFTILVPVNWTNNTLKRSNLTYSDLDKLSISNIPMGSSRYRWLVDSKLFMLSSYLLYVIVFNISLSNECDLRIIFT